MRSEDWEMSLLLKKHWQGESLPDLQLCPLLADPDRLLVTLDEQQVMPGDALLPCPACGDHHRWTLLKELIAHALILRPENPTNLMQLVDASLEEARAYYGGKKGYEAYLEAAEQYFSQVKAGRVYKL